MYEIVHVACIEKKELLAKLWLGNLMEHINLFGSAIWKSNKNINFFNNKRSFSHIKILLVLQRSLPPLLRINDSGIEMLRSVMIRCDCTRMCIFLRDGYECPEQALPCWGSSQLIGPFTAFLLSASHHSQVTCHTEMSREVSLIRP
jgi:hypothetical protein